MDIFKDQVNKIDDQIKEITEKADDVLDRDLPLEEMKSKIDDLDQAEQKLFEKKRQLLNEHGTPHFNRVSKMQRLKDRANLHTALARGGAGLGAAGAAYGGYSMLGNSKEEQNEDVNVSDTEDVNKDEDIS